MLGLAVGDVAGTALEFKSPGSFAIIDDMVGGGPFRLAIGEWTDHTSMALGREFNRETRVRSDRPVGAIHAVERRWPLE